MDLYEAMAKPHGDFVRGICRIFDPVARIVDCLLNFRRDLIGFNTDIAGTRTVLASPTPYIREHPPVQLGQEITVENIAQASIGPADREGNIGLLGVV